VTPDVDPYARSSAIRLRRSSSRFEQAAARIASSDSSPDPSPPPTVAAAEATNHASRNYPCDDLVPGPAWLASRGVTVNTAPDVTWPWIAQIRLVPYLYDWIDNLGLRSPREL
jgi:hypothetical protein